METGHEETPVRDHIEWCKQRANEYIDMGDLPGALASFTSDMQKHPEAAERMTIMAPMGMMAASSEGEMRKFIDGF